MIDNDNTDLGYLFPMSFELLWLSRLFRIGVWCAQPLKFEQGVVDSLWTKGTTMLHDHQSEHNYNNLYYLR